MKHITIFVLLLSLVSACGKSNSTSPTSPSATATRAISVSGNLAFGDVLVGANVNAQMSITNSGSATLSIAGMTGPNGFAASWVSGTISPGTTQPVTVSFVPTAPGTYSGVITINGDQTSGTNTIVVSGTAFPTLLGGWSGSLTVSALGLSNVCNDSWVVTSQTGARFSGTWQTSGGTLTPCSQAGTLTGDVALGGAITDLKMGVVLGASGCTIVAGTEFSGVLSGTNLSAQKVDTMRCPSAPDVNRSLTIAVRKQ